MLEGDTKISLVDTDIKKEVNNDSKKKWIIIGVVCGVVIVAGIIVLLIFLLKDKDNNEEEKKELKFITWAEAHEKAKAKVKEFTDEEKFNLIFGTQNMQKKTEDGGCVGAIDPVEGKFGGICLQDGPAGVRFSTSTQSWQAGINTASTFNRTLMYEVGKAQGKEFREKGVNVALTPAMNIQTLEMILSYQEKLQLKLLKEFNHKESLLVLNIILEMIKKQIDTILLLTSKNKLCLKFISSLFIEASMMLK